MSRRVLENKTRRVQASINKNEFQILNELAKDRKIIRKSMASDLLSIAIMEECRKMKELFPEWPNRKPESQEEQDADKSLRSSFKAAKN